MSVKVLLVVQDGEACLHYIEVLNRVGVEVEIVSSLEEVGVVAPQAAFNGLLVDVPTMMRANAAEKSLLQELLTNIPTLRLRWDAASKSVRALTTRRQAQGSWTLASFLIETCGTFPPRRIRSHPRLNFSYSLEISLRENFIETDTQKSITMNVSRGGCFLFTTSDWVVGSSLWLRFRGIKDRSPIQAEVRWQQFWGGKQCIPGIGVEFKQISLAQRDELVSTIQNSLTDPQDDSPD